MSCPHGNPIGGCDTCDEVDAAFEAGKRSALAEQPAQGCDFCNNPLYAGTVCKNCGRLAEQPAQSLPFGVGGGLVAIKTLLSRDPCGHANTAIQMIDAILAEQPAQQEPVFWQILNGVCHAGVRSTKNLAKEAAAGMQKIHDLGGSLAAFHVRPLYKSPPASKPWVGLTDEDHAEVKDVMIHVGVGAGVAWIENKLRERNT